MDPTTLVTFLFRAPPETRIVELLGSWDNFTHAYSMQRDRRRGHDFWSGCFRFEDIIFDGDDGSASFRPRRARPRSGGLKQGGTYWYFYRLDCGDVETHDPARPVTSNCPLLPGQLVNMLEVPMEVLPLPSRRRSEVLDVDASVPIYLPPHTLDPRDKYARLAPPARSKVHWRCVSDLALNGRLESSPLSPPSTPFGSPKAFAKDAKASIVPDSMSRPASEKLLPPLPPPSDMSSPSRPSSPAAGNHPSLSQSCLGFDTLREQYRANGRKTSLGPSIDLSRPSTSSASLESESPSRPVTAHGSCLPFRNRPRPRLYSLPTCHLLTEIRPTHTSAVQSPRLSPPTPAVILVPSPPPPARAPPPPPPSHAPPMFITLPHPEPGNDGDFHDYASEHNYITSSLCSPTFSAVTVSSYGDPDPKRSRDSGMLLQPFAALHLGSFAKTDVEDHASSDPPEACTAYAVQTYSPPPPPRDSPPAIPVMDRTSLLQLSLPLPFTLDLPLPNSPLSNLPIVAPSSRPLSELPLRSPAALSPIASGGGQVGAGPRSPSFADTVFADLQYLGASIA